MGRQAVLIRQPPNPFTFAHTGMLGTSLDGTSGGEWPGALLGNLRGRQAHGIGGRIVSTPLPPPFPPIPQFAFAPTVAVGELDTGWHDVGIPPVSVGAVAAPRTLGGSALYDAGLGVLATVPGDATRGNGLRAFALSGAPTGCGPATATHDCPLWATPLDGTTVSQPVIGDDGATLYVGTDVGTVYAVDATTGAVRWQAPVGSAVTGAVALADGTVFVPTASGDLVALAAGGCGDATCSPVWSGATGSSVSQQPAVAGEVVYTASADGSLHAFAAEGCGDDTTCPALWSESTGRQLSDGPIVSGGWLYVSFDSGSGTQGGGVVAYSL